MLPATRLNRVDLPAPFGPIRPVIEPRFTDSEQCRTATRPPKLLLTSWTSITISAATRAPPLDPALEFGRCEGLCAYVDQRVKRSQGREDRVGGRLVDREQDVVEGREPRQRLDVDIVRQSGQRILKEDERVEPALGD